MPIPRAFCRLAFALPFVCVGLISAKGLSQDRLPLLPGYKQYAEAREALKAANAKMPSFPGGSFGPDGAFYTTSGEKSVRIDLGTGAETEARPPAARTGGGRAPARGRQRDTVASPDGQWTAQHLDRNVVLVKRDNSEKFFVTTDGNSATRIKYGTASWVYGEELDQRDAMWWSPDSKKLAYYRFDESSVSDYFVTLNQGAFQNKLYPEAYPKAGAPNPKVGLFVYDLETKINTPINCSFEPGIDPDISHYVYAIRWLNISGTVKLLYFRMNRQQSKMQICLADPSTGDSKVVLTEENPTGWVDYKPGNVWTDSGDEITTLDNVFIWISERTGFRNLYLYNYDGAVVQQLTNFQFDVHSVRWVDAKRKEIWFMARSANNPLHQQLHRISFDGSGLVRLTDEKLAHSVTIAPDGSGFLDTAESFEMPPIYSLINRDGKTVKTLFKVSAKPLWDQGFKPVERFQCLAADGKTTITGYLKFPRNFDNKKKYPLIVDVYGGPESGTNNERFVRPDTDCDLGFVMAWIDGRGTVGRGRAFRQAVYKNLGVVEIDDQAAAVKYLRQRNYIRADRVGINGTSYGGYASLMALLRHPDVFHAASCSSSVTDWRHYDSIYTERYMNTPQNNPTGYQAGSGMTYAKNLRGRLLMFYGTADDNVHPSNTHTMVQALDRAGKWYELSIGVDQGHAGVNHDRMMEFFIDALVLGNLGGRK